MIPMQYAMSQITASRNVDSAVAIVRAFAAQFELSSIALRNPKFAKPAGVSH
jgi:hypothetical protein